MAVRNWDLQTKKLSFFNFIVTRDDKFAIKFWIDVEKFEAGKDCEEEPVTNVEEVLIAGEEIASAISSESSYPELEI